MSIIRQLPAIVEEAEFLNRSTDSVRFCLAEEWAGDRAGDHGIYLGDNISLMQSLLREGEMAGKIQLVYIDPPFFTGVDHDAVVEAGGRRIRHPAYRDVWDKGMKEYLVGLTRSLLLIRELLASDGLIWLHLDWHAVHYARVLMDEVFGPGCFVNEIIWEYKSGGSSGKRFARKHDNLLVYSKGKSFKFHPLKEKSYNRGLKPYRFKGVEEFCDEKGWYTMVNMKDVWQLDMVGRTSSERTGYATQKPEHLMERIIESCTAPGDICADFFSGSGTLGIVAAKTGRRGILCDRESLAVEKTLERFGKSEYGVRVYVPEDKAPARRHGERAFDVDIHREDNGLTLLQVKDFCVPREMDVKSAALLTEIQEEDPMQLISGWSADLEYDGTVFRPDQVMRRGKKGLETAFLAPAPRGEGMVRVSDVLGRVEYFRV